MTWIDVGAADDVARRRKFVVEHDGTPIVVIAHEGRFYALDNICIHKQRELVKGVILGDRIVCPGHQWAYQLDSGWEAKMERCQPTYDIRVNDGRVEVDVDTPRVVTGPPAAEAAEAAAAAAAEVTPG